jgi:hypothetical protein
VSGPGPQAATRTSTFSFPTCASVGRDGRREIQISRLSPLTTAAPTPPPRDDRASSNTARAVFG